MANTNFDPNDPSNQMNVERASYRQTIAVLAVIIVALFMIMLLFYYLHSSSNYQQTTTTRTTISAPTTTSPGTPPVTQPGAVETRETETTTIQRTLP